MGKCQLAARHEWSGQLAGSVQLLVLLTTEQASHLDERGIWAYEGTGQDPVAKDWSYPNLHKPSKYTKYIRL